MQVPFPVTLGTMALAVPNLPILQAGIESIGYPAQSATVPPELFCPSVVRGAV